MHYQLAHSGCAFDPECFDSYPAVDCSESTESPVQNSSRLSLPGYLSLPTTRYGGPFPSNNAWRTSEHITSLSAASQKSTPVDSAMTSSASSQSLVSDDQNTAFPTTDLQLDRPVGYSATRRSSPSFGVEQPGQVHALKLQDGVPRNPRQLLRKSSSCIRLSLSNEGNAKVVTKDGSSPSPPRAPPSQQLSACDGIAPQSSATPSIYSNNIPLFKPMQRSSSGRSRDSRAWEFWCDKDARGELEGKAEKDASGSAADAIDLLRSASGRRVLGTLPNKRNSFLSREIASKRPKLDEKPTLLKRSSTSLGRLQNHRSDATSSTSGHVVKPKHSESASSTYIPGNDSDKENWSPTTTESSDDATSHGNILQGQVAVSQVARNPQADPEIAAFMRPSKSASISQEEELDCVQNLLSLSQGNWR